jgi:CO/xanthine dehydrogenase Mo-binding subunit
MVAQKLGLDPADCCIAGGRVFRTPGETEGEPLRPYLEELAREGVSQLAEAIYHAPPTVPIGEAKPGQDLHFCYGFSTQIARVKVDLKTGKTQVLDMVAAVDVGRALSPALIEGQVEGSISMGLGYALSEELVLQEGVTKNLNFNKYRIPNIRTQPNVTVVLVEDTHPDGPHGAKGVAELPSIPTLPAIINAIYYATGVRVTHLPATPNKIVAGLAAKKELAGATGD